MSEEWVIEVEEFGSSKEAIEWARKNIKERTGKRINAISRDINVIEL